MIMIKKVLEKLQKDRKELEEKLENISYVDVPAQVSNNITTPITDNVKLSKNVFTDVEMFMNFQGSSDNTIYSKLASFFHTKGTHLVLKHVLENPITHIETLVARQNLINDVLKQNTSFDSELSTIQKYEQDIFWLFEETDENLQSMYDTVYFRFWFTKKLNKIPSAVTSLNLYKLFLSPAIGILSPIIYFIIPFLAIRYKLGIHIDFLSYVKFLFNSMINGDIMSTLLGFNTSMSTKVFRWASFALSLLFYFQGMINSVEVSRMIHKISKFLTQKTNNIILGLTAASKIVSAIWSDDMTQHICSLKMFDISAEQELLNKMPAAKSYSVFGNFGSRLTFLKNIDKQAVTSLMSRFYLSNFCIGCVNLLKNHKSVSLCEYVASDVPKVISNNIWHFCLDEQKVVKNDLNIEGKNVVLTGPNAGGKSTFIKALISNILLGQTIGICFADSCKLSPFETIHTQINVPDVKGKESLFEAEMYRCKETLGLCKSPGTKLIVMDEIFSSTNPVEGISGAYAVAKKISQDQGAMLLFTTHFVYLTKLAKKVPDRFINYKMNVTRNENGDIEFPYKLESGISKQFVALELLKKNGYDADVIEEALNMKEYLTS